MKKENAALFSYSDKQKTLDWEDEIVAIFNCYKANSFSKYVLLKELSIYHKLKFYNSYIFAA